MDFEDAITATKIFTKRETLYLMIGWQSHSFEMYLYGNDKVWKGKFSPNRLASFSRNLQMTEKEYIKNTKHCLSEQRPDYIYELKSGFFYWKRKTSDTIIIEGFLPVEVETSPKNVQPDLIEVLLAVNKHLKCKANHWQWRCKNIEKEYQKCLKDTQEFLNLKLDMEKALCDKFLNLLNLKKNKLIHDCKDNLSFKNENANSFKLA
ncbi:DNA repair protein XRCC4-like [Colias croceus]|uniref:DNA repair protein XRCC4-like n=1 Tax=Colias crocea TaxID=72248 RepID=UPI001E27C598|nr:DNA repair protein XRCC4-like [Colias croceus]